MSGSALGELALEVLALVHHLAAPGGVDARDVHTVINRPDVKPQRVRSTLYNLAALGYLARGAAPGLFIVTRECKAPPAHAPMRKGPAVPPPGRAQPRPASLQTAQRPHTTLEGTLARLHTPNSVFDVERL